MSGDTGTLSALSSLLDEALDLPEEGRLAWVASRADLSDEMRARLRELLMPDAATGFELPPLPSYADKELDSLGANGLPAQASIDAAGTRIGPYRLIREIGRGGMGTVWLAERTDGNLNRQVALKLPHLALSGQRFVERFARERDILAELEHPNIARLYDAGIADNGRPYLAMEFVQGQNLLDYCRKRKLEMAARLQLFLQVLDAVQYAHSRLVVHRDLKPGNMLVTGEGHVHLLDFGIARLIDEQGQSDHVTVVGERMLTPHYAAPEQILGQSIGTGADVYSLGVVLYELLTGELPYRPRRDTQGAIEDAILDTEPPLASTTAEQHCTAGWVRRLRGDLDTILRKALKKDPQARYPTAAAFADDIKRHLDGQPVLAQRDSFVYRAGKFLRRHRWAVAATTLVVLSLSGGLGTAIWQARVAQEHAELARKEARTAEAIKDFLQDIFLANSAQQTDPIQARQTTARELLDIGAGKLEDALADTPEALGEMLWMFSELYSQLLLPDRAAAFAQRRLELIRKTHGNESPELGVALFMVVATAQSAWMDDPRIPDLLNESRRIFASHPELPERHRVVLAQSAEYWSDHDFPRALREVREAMQIQPSTLTDASVPPLRAAAVELLAGDAQRAREAALQGLAAEEAAEAMRIAGESRSGDGGMLQTPSIVSLLADAYRALGQRDEAIAQGRKALAAARNVFGDTDPDTARLQARLSCYLRAQDQLPEADALLAAATTTLAEARPNDRSRLRFHALVALGKAQADAARHREAVATLTRALAMRDPSIDASPAIADLLRDLARAQLGLGNRAEATRTLERAISMRVKAGIAPPEVLKHEAALSARLASRNIVEPSRQG